jgi:hypothetical protein
MKAATLEKPQEIVVHEAPPQVPAVRNDADSLMDIISRAASDETINIDKLERLMAMHATITERQALQVFNDAMANAQKEMRRIAADSNNSQTHSKYASYAALDRVIRPIYTKHGFGLSFNTGEGPPEGCVRVVCDVSNGGYTRHYHIDMPNDGKGAKGGDVMTKTHATGSAITYGRRYLLTMIFNLAVGEDDDGNAAGDTAEKISDEQVENLKDMLTASGCSETNFLKWLRTNPKAKQVERLDQIPDGLYDICVSGIENYKAAQAKKAQEKAASR